MSEQRNREDENLMEGTRRNTENDLERERERAVELFQERVGRGGTALNIALIGASGCGKSSFCNSVLAAFCVEGWRERATVGHYGGLGEQITHHLMSFPKIEYLDFDALYDYNYPTLVDMNGFNDSCDDMVEELLRIVFFGRLPQEEKLMDAVKLYRSKGLDGLKEKYSRNYELLKIDRIIFIASATSPLPNRLMEAVRKTARKEDRVIPVFGVLTHKDKIREADQDFQALEKDFREGLGLPDNRFLLCTTYCDDYDRHHGKSRLDQRHPELDIPILKFMRQVCDPVFKVIKDQTKYNKDAGEPAADSTTPTATTDQKPAWFGIAAQGLPPAVDRRWIRWAVIAVLVYFLLPFLTNGLDINRVCAEHCTNNDHGTRCTSGSLQSLCVDQSSLRKGFVTFLFVGAIVGVDLLMDKLEEIGRTERN